MEVIVVFVIWLGILVGGITGLERIGWHAGWFTATVLYCAAFWVGVEVASAI